MECGEDEISSSIDHIKNLTLLASSEYNEYSIDSGRTDQYIIRNGSWTAQMYANETLRSLVVPYAAAIEHSFLLIQYNARRPTACLGESFLEAETI
ncbi:hypothetical protein TNCV_370101 [Trichonephila clavipes]|nr:hypothetical protein TNCV_370101 [Trichonephila clavipes]